MGEGPNRVLVRFFYEAHEYGMTSCPMGSYREIDFMPGESGVRQRMRGYYSVMVIKQLDGYDAQWLARYTAGKAIEYDGTTVYIYRTTYGDACKVLTDIAKEYAHWQEVKNRPVAPFPGNAQGTAGGSE